MLFRIAVLVSFVTLVVPNRLAAQGFFEGFGFPKPVTATGHTEILGSVHVGLRYGSTVSDTLIIDISPMRITNASASDIRVSTGGNVTVGAVTIEAAEGRVRVPVNAGATSGNLRIDGIRTSVAGMSLSSVTARLSWAGQGNIFTGGQSVVLVDQVRSGLAVDPMTDTFRIYVSTVIDSTATIVLREGFARAFTNSAEFGQDTPTRIRVKVTDFPSGLILRFPATVTASETAATLTTASGAPVELRADGTTEVTYNFNAAGNSVDTLESFGIAFTVATDGIVANLQPTIEVSLATLGAAVPSAGLPAANIPRFAEDNIVALEGTSRIITKTLYWTGIDNTRETRLSIFNPSSSVSRIVLEAFNASGQLVSGPNVTNSIRELLAANQSSDRSLTEIFGSGASSIATIRVQSTSRDVVALGTTSASGLSESAPLLDRGIPNFVVPSVGEDGRMQIFNPGSSRVSGTVTLRSSAGAPFATASLDIDAMASVSRTLQELFGSQLQGQVFGSFSGPVIAYESFGTTNTLNYIAGQVAAGSAALLVPFFATGSGYETDLNLINSSDQTVTVTAQIVDSQGSASGSSRPITIPAGQQFVTTIGQLFQMTNFSSGYVRIQVPQMSRGFWTFYPAITGHARIRSGQTASTVLPLSGYPQSAAAIPASGVVSGQFQGIAVVNPNSSTVTVTMEALSSAGTSLGSTTVSLAPGQISSKLIGEYFTFNVPERSVIRVTSSLPVVTTSVTGSTAGDVLRSVPGLR